MTDKDKTTRQPEALRTFEKAARSGGRKPGEQGLSAEPETAPKPDSTQRKAKTASQVLRAGVEHDPQKAGDAVRKSRDPRIP